MKLARDSDPDYTLGVGKEGEERLNILNEIYNQDSQSFLLKAGIESAKCVLDVGCGTGEMACWIANNIAPGGKVLALDYSEKQLSIARENADKLKIKNIEFIKLSAYDLRELNTQYDFIYSRFVLAHLNNPEKIIQAMCDVLAPDGVLACEDAKTSGHYCSPASQDFNRYVDIWTKLRNHKGADPDFGIKLPIIFRKNGLQGIQTMSHECDLDTLRKRRIFELNIKECRHDAIEANLTTEEEMNYLQDSMSNLAKENPYVRTLRFSTSMETFCKKPTKEYTENKNQFSQTHPLETQYSFFKKSCLVAGVVAICALGTAIVLTTESTIQHTL